MFVYHDAAGHPLGAVARYEFTRHGKRDKATPQVTWGSKDGGKTWGWALGHWNLPRPLYGLELLTGRPKAPVLVVEGEKTAEAARQLLPRFVVVTWPGGSKAVSCADWRPLAGRDVTCWPDADAPGVAAMEEVRALLAPAAQRVRWLDVTGQPDAWDLADALEEGMDHGPGRGVRQGAGAESAPSTVAAPAPGGLPAPARPQPSSRAWWSCSPSPNSQPCPPWTGWWTACCRSGSDVMLYGHPGSFKSRWRWISGALWRQAVPGTVAPCKQRRWCTSSGRPPRARCAVRELQGPARHHGRGRLPGARAALPPRRGQRTCTPDPRSIGILPTDAAERPLLLIVDTVRKCTPGGDENESGRPAEAAGLAHRPRRRDYPLLTVLLLDHPGGGRQLRGELRQGWKRGHPVLKRSAKEGARVCTPREPRDPPALPASSFDTMAPARQHRGGRAAGDRGGAPETERNVLQLLADLEPEGVSWPRWQDVRRWPSTPSTARKRLLRPGLALGRRTSRRRALPVTDEGRGSL